MRFNMTMTQRIFTGIFVGLVFGLSIFGGFYLAEAFGMEVPKADGHHLLRVLLYSVGLLSTMFAIGFPVFWDALRYIYIPSCRVPYSGK